jgi:hypothetical protein
MLATCEPTVTERCEQLVDLCRHWRALTAAEGEAIRRTDWHAVEQLQDAKRDLQEPITQAAEELWATCTASHANRPALERQLRPLVGDILRMEAHNRGMVASLQQQIRQEQQNLDDSLRNLHHLQQAYVPGREAAWHSYS